MEGEKINSLLKYLQLSLVLVITTCTADLSAQQPVVLEVGRDSYSLDGKFALLEDPSGQLTFADVLSDSIQQDFVVPEKPIHTLKFTSSAYWLRFIVKTNQAAGKSPFQSISRYNTLILVKNEPLIEDIRFYQKLPVMDTLVYLDVQAGSIVPVESKEIKTYDFIALLNPNPQIQDTFYLRIKTRSQFILSYSLHTFDGFINRSESRKLFHGILFGILILLMIYNLFLYYTVKELVFIYYVLYIFCYMVMVFTYQGYFFEIFGQVFDRDYFIIPAACISFGGVFWLFLTYEFLSLKTNLGGKYRWIIYLAPIAPIIPLITFGLYLPALAPFITAVVISYYILGFVVSIIALKRGVKIALYYIIGLIGMAVGIFITSNTRNNFITLPYNFWTQNAVHIGLLWEAIVLAAAVGFRFNQFKKEQEYEKGLIRNRIASDLHDEIGSNLSTITLQGKMIVQAGGIEKKYIPEVNEIISIAGKTNDLIRDIVWFINPFHDSSEDLVLRMRETASKMLNSINYSFDINQTPDKIFSHLVDLNQRRHLYLMYKEILNNIVKHSNANNATITLYTYDDHLELKITDDGDGFNSNEPSSGSGLANLRNRANLISAELSIIGSPSQGTAVSVTIPFH